MEPNCSRNLYVYDVHDTRISLVNNDFNRSALFFLFPSMKWIQELYMKGLRSSLHIVYMGLFSSELWES